MLGSGGGGISPSPWLPRPARVLLAILKLDECKLRVCFMWLLLICEGYLCIDEDIPAITPSPIANEDAPIAAKKIQSNEIRIGPITRARAKLLEQ